jgi:hypothetical protein
MQNLLLMSDMDAVGPHCAANFRFNRPMAERWVKFAVAIGGKADMPCCTAYVC